MWYLIVRTPTEGSHIYPVGTDSGAFEGYVQAAVSIHGAPEDWAFTGLGWDLSLTQGEPHSTLLAQSTVHEVPPGA